MGTYQQEYLIVMGTYQQEYVLMMGTYQQEYVIVMGTYMLPLYDVLVMGTYLLPLYELLNRLGLPVGVQSTCYRRTISLLSEYVAYNRL